MNNKNITKDIVVIYHGDCPDGFGGAWAAWKKLGDSADYFAVHHDDKPLEGLKDKEIFFIDIVYKRPVLEEVKSANRKITIIDHHHKTAELLGLADDSLFTNDNSGAVLSWQYFHPGKAVPRFLKYLEERDLWRWVTKESRPILAYVSTLKYDFNDWDEIITQLDSDETAVSRFEKDGQLVLRNWFSICDDILKDSAFFVEFEGYRICAVNAPSIFADDLGDRLVAKNFPLALIWHQNKDGNILVSLRSGGEVDVSEVAGKFGGGGHKRSSAFRIKYGEKIPWKKIK